MNDFFTTLKIEPSLEKINHKNKLFFIGSCFSNEISERFHRCGYLTFKNPFGILYNPLSIAECLDRVMRQEFFIEKDLIFNNEYYYLLSAHGDFRAKDKQTCLNLINKNMEKSYNFLKDTDYIFITLGTAWTYWYKPSNTLMGNCHKIDNTLIDRRMVTYTDMANILRTTINNLRTIFNKDYHFMFTVSPIRHWKEGYRDNLISKSHLHLAIEELRKNNNIEYFPSYEIVTDTLRDYRFYAEDMLHINSVAVDYIWKIFSQTYFSQETLSLNNQFLKLWTMKNHRPINPDTKAYKKHLDKIALLEKEFQPHTIKDLG